MISDPELEQWSALWRSGEALDAKLAERARKAVWRFRAWIYLEVLVTVVMGGGATIWAVRAHQTPVTLLAIWVWISLAVAWLFRLISDWNDFTGAAVATGSYLATLLRRLRSSVRAAEFGGVLFFVQLLVTSTSVFRELNRQGHVGIREYLALPPNVVFAIGSVGFVVWLVRYRRRLRREIAELERMRVELGGDCAAPVAGGKISNYWSEIWESMIANGLDRLGRLRKKRMRVW
jgi:hypothetical protein